MPVEGHTRDTQDTGSLPDADVLSEGFRSLDQFPSGFDVTFKPNASEIFF